MMGIVRDDVEGPLKDELQESLRRVEGHIRIKQNDLLTEGPKQLQKNAESMSKLVAAKVHLESAIQMLKGY